MGFLRDAAYAAAGLLASPWLLFKAASDVRYRHRLGERFGALPRLQRPLWFHCASVGEVNAVRPLVRRLRKERPEMPLFFTTVTRAGREQAALAFPESPAAYFPLDFSCAARRALERVDPCGVVLVELEVWPNFMEQCVRRNIPVAVVNGRMSRRAFGRYRRFSLFLGEAFRRLAAVGVQNETYAERLRSLGASPVVTGNLKYDAQLSFDPAAAAREWRERLSLGDAPVLVAGSTHDPEERLLTEAFKVLRGEFPRLRFILAPRHLERIPEVEKVVEAAGLGCYKKSRLSPGDAWNGVLLVDTVGELSSLYAAADVVFIGGTFCDRGGQNMLEPAVLGKPIVSGPSVANFEDAAGALAAAGGMRILGGPGELSGALGDLLRDPARAREAGERAREAVRAGQGAVEANYRLVETAILKGR